MPQCSIEKLPEYLRRYCASQDYAKYTARDHSAWRYIMRQSCAFFKDNAVAIYLDGLKSTGIPTDHIPKISEMDKALQEFGWGAVPVCGFIPPIAFLDLQARKILPIATDMRTIDHIAYTPAPDIVHEAAGHAPIIADREYRDYLTRYAEVAKKAIMSREDLNLYEAIRVLSDLKENPDATEQDKKEAQRRLDLCSAKVSFVSEAAKVSRMAWWTVEYGLLGDLKKPKIYGAGLLSSVQESQNFMSEKVRRLPLTLKCIETTYDITEPQPQLYVAENVAHLNTVLDELENKLSGSIGGVYALEEMRKAHTVNTLVLDNGIEISGILTKYEAEVNNDKGIPHFVAFSGPVQLSVNSKEIAGQGRSQHPQGFSMPLGRWNKHPNVSPSRLSDEQLNSIGVVQGQFAKIQLINGFSVEGKIERIVKSKDKIQYITWSQCTVTRGEAKYFEPSWGDFDMPVAEQVVSAFGGPSDREAYGEYDMGGVSTNPGRTSPYSELEIAEFQVYSKISDARKQSKNADSLASEVLSKYQEDWLLNLELYELSFMGLVNSTLKTKLKSHLEFLSAHSSSAVLKNLISMGIDKAAHQ